MNTQQTAAPAFMYVTFKQLTDMFGDQVLKQPFKGQRNHKALMKMGRNHITALPAVPTTQAIFQAVYYSDLPSTASVMLIDGYHRIQHWMTSEEGCPFEKLILITHSVTASSNEERLLCTDDIARTIDNRSAAKTPADRWFSGMRAADFNPKSKGYALGLDMNIYLRHTLGSSKQPVTEMATILKSRLADHTRMDTLMEFAEVHIPEPMRRKFFHGGVALAVFDKLENCQNPDQLLKTVRHALMLSCGYTWANPPKAAAALSAQLNWLAQSDVRDRMRATCNDRTEFYKAVAAVLGKALDTVIAEM